ncbi:MAG: hypothetical protein KGM16_09940 [Bacteroidota bacterium]|nr:hypothetical protein [Bacteroidota bacterium]
MKKILFIFLLIGNTCLGQGWVAEVMLGVSGYNGDLTQQRVAFNTMRPAMNINIKYNTGNFINFRAGIGFGAVAGNDKYNTHADLKARNLNFKTNILEANIGFEIPLMDPAGFYAYPYFFGCVGVFHFNPYTYDKNNVKTYLQPLSTEGEGLPQYSSRKKYSLTQVCLPVGLGWKVALNEKWEICYEFGYRFLFTDYLDDVSKTYVNLDVLNQAKGPKAVEMAYRKSVPFVEEGLPRGNPTKNDSYFFSGIKLGLKL